MNALFNIARTGVTSLFLHPLRTAVSILCLLVVLVPYIAGMGVLAGLEREADASIAFGADLYVSAETPTGRAPLPTSLIPEIRRIPGVTAVVPRIVGWIAVGADQEPAVLVGLPADAQPHEFRWLHGALYRENGADELVVGTELARRLHLAPGSTVPPFYHNPNGDHLARVVGVFGSEVSLWQSRMILTSFRTARRVFAQKATASDLLVTCRPDAVESIRTAIRTRFLSDPALNGMQCRTVTRADLRAMVPSGISHQGGLFHLHFLLASVVGILTLVVCSGIGQPDRRREVGILKATGWQTDEILLRGLVESTVISALSASLSLLLAYVWLKPLDGLGIAALLLPGVDWRPSFDIPYRLAPMPALVGLLFAWVMVTSGVLFSLWRASTTPPREAMR